MKQIAFVIIFALLFSCSKNNEITKDISAPVIRIQYPLDNPVLPKGFPLCIKAVISDDRNLASVTFEVSDGSLSKEYIPSTRYFDVIEKHVVDPTLSGQFTATFKAMDEAGNISSVSIPFSINN